MNADFVRWEGGGGRGDRRSGRREEKQNTALARQSHSITNLQQGLSGEKAGLGFVWTGSHWENTKHLPGQLR